MSTIRTLIAASILVLGGLSGASAQTLDISSGGAPSITGAVGGSVSGSSSVLSNLVVTVNFGELSPVNPNNIVKVRVPIAVRSNQPYRVTATLTGSTNANPQAIQATDVGFGIQNWREMGNQSRNCNRSPHIFYSPFNNDPAVTRTISASGRAAYPSDFSDLAGGVTLITGPQLSNGNSSRGTTDGYIFDAILAITPQFYAQNSSTATITFSISSGPNVPC